MLVCTGPTAGSVRCACLPKLQTRLFWAVAKQSLFLWWLHLPCVDQPITKCSRECGRNPADLPSPFDQLSPMASQEKRSGKRASVTDPETRVAHCFLSSSSIIPPLCRRQADGFLWLRMAARNLSQHIPAPALHAPQLGPRFDVGRVCRRRATSTCTYMRSSDGDAQPSLILPMLLAAEKCTSASIPTPQVEPLVDPSIAGPSGHRPSRRHAAQATPA